MTGAGALLSGRTVLVLGATGGIGEGVTRTLAHSGASVVMGGRDGNRLARTAASVSDGPFWTGGTLSAEVIDLAGTDPEVLRGRLTGRYGRIDAVVIAIGDWGPTGRLGIIDTPDEIWDAMIADNLTSHFHALRALTPLLGEQGVLVHLSGFSAEIPYPFAALVAATNAAKKSLVRSLTAEVRGTPRVHELMIGPIRTRRRAATGIDDPGWFSAEQLGAHIADLVAGVGPYASQPLQYLLDRSTGVRTTRPD